MQKKIPDEWRIHNLLSSVALFKETPSRIDSKEASSLAFLKNGEISRNWIWIREDLIGNRNIMRMWHSTIEETNEQMEHAPSKHSPKNEHFPHLSQEYKWIKKKCNKPWEMKFQGDREFLIYHLRNPNHFLESHT